MGLGLRWPRPAGRRSGSGPVASLPHMEPSRPAGVTPGTSVAQEWLRPPMWGDRDRPQQGGCPEKVRQPLYMAGVTPHVWRLRAETPGTRMS
jgi:hypothetical protein